MFDSQASQRQRGSVVEIQTDVTARAHPGGQVIVPEPEQHPVSTAKALDEARNLLDLLLVRAREPDRLGAKFKVGASWQSATWGQMLERVRGMAAGLSELGIGRGDRVAIFTPTRYEWVLANLATYGVGAITVPIYASNTPQEIEHILRDSGARAVFVDRDQPEGRSAGRWTRLKAVRGNLPALEHVIGFDLRAPDDGLISLADLEEKGASRLLQHRGELEEVAASIQPDDLAYIVYTSGTTGTPKGVMLSHHAWTSEAKAAHDAQLLIEGDLILLFLPLAHSFALVVMAAWLGVGTVMAFAESIERAVDNAAELKATVLPAVPRVFEKAFSKVVSDGSSAPGLKGRLFHWAMRQFEDYVAAKVTGRELTSIQWLLAKRLVFAKIEERLKARFGGRMRLFVSGGAPLSNKIAYFFDACGLLICEGYGLTETCAGTFVNRPTNVRIGTVGPAIKFIEAKIAEDGEILVRGPQIMKGYYNLPKETAEALEPDGWFHTGDIGELEPDGALRITDRKKDLIKTSGGKYVAPQELENALTTEPLISQVLVHGDRRKYVTALITVSEENARKWAQERGVPAESFAELTRRPEIRARVQAAVDTLNASQPSYATVKKFAILDHEWSLEAGEVTPKLNVKRKFVTTKYLKMLDALYEGEAFG